MNTSTEHFQWIAVFIGIAAMSIAFVALLALLFATYRKGSAIFAIINKPGTGGPYGQDMNETLFLCRDLGLFGLFYSGGLLLIFLTIRKNYYWERWRRKSVKLDVHLVPLSLRCWILLPGYVFVISGAIFFAVCFFWLKLPSL